MSARQIINELFDRAEGAQITSDTEHDFEARFSVGDSNYSIECIPVAGGRWLAGFTFHPSDGSKHRYDITGTGNEFRVFATVLTVLENWALRRRPSVIRFSAAEASRRKLYDRLAPKLAAAIGYAYSATDNGQYGLQRPRSSAE